MKIDAAFLDGEPVRRLCQLCTTRYTIAGTSALDLPSIANMLGACAGFAAQIAVWRELIFPNQRNPGDFLVFITTKSREIFFFGDSINLFLYGAMPDRLSFLSLAGTVLRSPADMPDLRELAAHVSKTVGSENFALPRINPNIKLAETPRQALVKNWREIMPVLMRIRPAEWPVTLGATFRRLFRSNDSLPPETALKIAFEAAIPMSKLNPLTVQASGITELMLGKWSMRAYRPENYKEILAEIRTAMPALDKKGPLIIERPIIAFLNQNGDAGAAELAADKAEIGPLFSTSLQSTTTLIPMCDVLFLYCSITPDGMVVGLNLPLREVVTKSTARIAVVASEVPTDILNKPTWLTAGQELLSNLIITTNRNGDTFAQFFKKLFGMMFRDVPMTEAWVTLAPQGPSVRDDVPGTLFIAGAGEMIFRTRA